MSEFKSLAKALMPPELFAKGENSERKFIEGVLAAKALYPFKHELLSQNKLGDDFKHALHSTALLLTQQHEALMKHLGATDTESAMDALAREAEVIIAKADEVLGPQWRDACVLDPASYMDPPSTLQ